MKSKAYYTILLLFSLTIIFSVNLHQQHVILAKAKSTVNSITVTEGQSIQEAINRASNGSTVYIEKGVYTEFPINVNKTVTIIGEDVEKTIITGNQASEATCLITITASHATVKNLTLTKAEPNIGRAIILNNVLNVTIENCNITECPYAIELSNSNYSKIIGNNITESAVYGIRIYKNSQSNIIALNQITENTHGISIDLNCKYNKIYNNNFINKLSNTVGLGLTSNFWNSTYTVGGNYWSNYLGTDAHSGLNQTMLGSDGIGDQTYQDIDYYPYMGKIQFFKMGQWNNMDYYVLISTNSTETSKPQFNITGKTLSFQVNQTDSGYCRIVIPKELLYAENKEWRINVDRKNTEYTKAEDANFTCLYFTYPREANEITITGTYIIPEFSQGLVLTLAWTSTIIILIANRKRRTEISSRKFKNV